MLHNNISSLTLRKNTSEILQSLENKHPTPLEQYEVQANPEPRTPCHGKTNGETTVSLRSEQVLRDRPESTGTAVLFLSGKEPDLLRAMTDGHEHQHGEKPSNNIKELTYYLFTPMGNFHTHRLVEKHGESCSCNTPRQLT
ncbi:uncharacterized protein isoform X6 [Danio rerio]|uniref:Uncharacterized protein isoform X6 n=1 Tax=Danio rerio TaxID=7955 RepID=A0AC58HLG7_DANRE